MSVRTSGPVFNGTAVELVTEYLKEATAEVADEGERDLRGFDQGSFRNPTGFYLSQVKHEPRGVTDQVIDDGGVIYGPWLEGTGSRNATTRFKGYHNWRRTTQGLDRKARSIAFRVLDAYVRRMNS